MEHTEVLDLDYNYKINNYGGTHISLTTAMT